MLHTLLKKFLSYKVYCSIIKSLKNIRKVIFYLVDICFSPLTLALSILFKFIKKNEVKNFPIAKQIFLKIGVYPIYDHYYEPLFNLKHLKNSLNTDHKLPGIDFNDNEQLSILSSFNYNNELKSIPMHKSGFKREYSYVDGQFNAGDAEYLYSIIRKFRPKRMIEIGCGDSTLLAELAIKKNKEEESQYNCEHICIEPFEQPWLEEIGIKVIREKVENVNIEIFKSLGTNDLLFIDSSHMIRPQGDVLFEYLELLPQINSGVIVHIHDIFSPKDYMKEWFGEKFWNEQYLLEAFLTHNNQFRIIGALHYLSHKYKAKFEEKCPIFKDFPTNGPGSFYIIKN